MGKAASPVSVSESVSLENQKPAGRQADGRTHAVKIRFSYKEAKEYETIEEDIAGIEDRLAAIEEEMAKKASDYSALNKLMEEKETLEAELLEKMDRWEYLEELAAKIAAQK